MLLNMKLKKRLIKINLVSTENCQGRQQCKLLNANYLWLDSQEKVFCMVSFQKVCVFSNSSESKITENP